MHNTEKAEKRSVLVFLCWGEGGIRTPKFTSTTSNWVNIHVQNYTRICSIPKAYNHGNDQQA